MGRLCTKVGHLASRGLIPFCEGVALTHPKPRRGYRLAAKTVGDHIANRRIDLGISQQEAARRMDLAIGSLVNWENDHTGMDPSACPKIIDFLGYNPLTEPKSRGEAVKRERLSRGLSVRRLAVMTGVAADTIRRLEADTPSMARRCVEAVLRSLGLASWPTLKEP